MTPTNHPAPESEREAIARMLKEQGFTSRDGTVINGGTYGVIDAILSRRLGAAPVAADPMTSTPPTYMAKLADAGLIEALEARANLDEYANSYYDKQHFPLLREAAARLRARYASPPAPALDKLIAETIPWKDDARQFPLYELMPDFTLIDRDPQADERLKLYRDIFAEITAKALPAYDLTSDDPERVCGYRLPVGPIHRAAGKLGFQLFNGEKYLADAVAEIARLKAAPALDARTVKACAVAVETQFIERQGHMPTPLYEDGYSDAIADAAKSVRNLIRADRGK